LLDGQVLESEVRCSADQFLGGGGGASEAEVGCDSRLLL
jgi:hypothetical protein